MKTKTISILMFILFTVLVVSACGQATETDQESAATLPAVVDTTGITAEGNIEPLRFAGVTFSTSGVVSEVLVEDGQSVKKGETLIRVGDPSDTNFAAAQLELVTAQQALNDLQNTSGADLAQTVIDLKDAKEDYDKAVNYLDYLKNSEKVPQTINEAILVQTRNGYKYEYKTKSFKGPAPKDWIIEAENDLALKKAKLDQLQRAYDRMKDGIDQEQLVLLEARLDAAQARVAGFSVIAPFDGVVAEVKAKVGNSINAGEIAVIVADFSNWVVKTTNLTELDVVTIKEGQDVTVTLDAIPDVKFNGKVQSIGQTYIEQQGDIIYEATIALTNSHPTMRWGMTAEVKFEQ